MDDHSRDPHESWQGLLDEGDACPDSESARAEVEDGAVLPDVADDRIAPA